MSLLIPFALECSSHTIVLPSWVPVGALARTSKIKGPFICTECKEEIIHVRESSRAQAHFKHKKESGCLGGEGNIHFAAKLLLAHYGSKCVFTSFCSLCKQNSTYTAPTDVIAKPEWPLEINTKNYRIDIAFFSSINHLVAFVEVMDTHAVEKEKWDSIQKEFPFVHLMEINAHQVITKFQNDTQKHYTISCLRSNFICQQCVKKEDKDTDKQETYFEVPNAQGVWTTLHDAWFPIAHTCEHCHKAPREENHERCTNCQDIWCEFIAKTINQKQIRIGLKKTLKKTTPKKVGFF
jgi:hypothetical protein